MKKRGNAVFKILCFKRYINISFNLPSSREVLSLSCSSVTCFLYCWSTAESRARQTPSLSSSRLSHSSFSTWVKIKIHLQYHHSFVWIKTSKSRDLGDWGFWNTPRGREGKHSLVCYLTLLSSSLHEPQQNTAQRPPWIQQQSKVKKNGPSHFIENYIGLQYKQWIFHVMNLRGIWDLF